MQFTIKRAKLAHAVGIVKDIGADRCYFQIRDGSLSVVGQTESKRFLGKLEAAGEGVLSISIHTRNIDRVLTNLHTSKVKLKILENKIRISGGKQRSDLLVAREDLPDIAQPETRDMSLNEAHVARSTDFSTVATGDFGYSSVRLDPSGRATASDTNNLFSCPFPCVEEDRPTVMVEASGLEPVKKLTTPVAVSTSENLIGFRDQSDNVYLVSLSTRRDPGFDRILSVFESNHRIDNFPTGKLVKELKNFMSIVMKSYEVEVVLGSGSGIILGHKPEEITYRSEFDTDFEGEMTFTAQPHHYLKIAPLLSDKAEIIVRNGSHLFLQNGEDYGVISCEANSVHFEE